MAQQIKFRLTAAKVGVSVALAALVGGVVEKLSSGQGEVKITPASSPGQFLKLGGLPQKIRGNFIKLEDKWIKLDAALSSVEHKLATKYLKIDDANTEFLKIRVADAKFITAQKATSEFLKLDDAALKYLKIDAANQEFLKIRAANSEFLKIKTAQNEFVQGRGGVVSAVTTSLADGSVRKLLQSPDGSLVVSVSNNADIIVVDIDNTTGALIPAVQTTDGAAPRPFDLKPGHQTIQLTGVDAAHQLQLQTFGDGSSKTATTLMLSTEGSATNPNGAATVVGQMLIGLL